MGRNLFLLLVLFWTGLSMGGCATKTDVFDAAAVPMARADLRFAIDLCNARTQDFGSKTTTAECWLAAQQRFVTDIKLTRPELFANYAARVRMLAAQADSRTITPDAFAQSYQQLTDEFDAAVFRLHDAAKSQ